MTSTSSATLLPVAEPAEVAEVQSALLPVASPGGEMAMDWLENDLERDLLNDPQSGDRAV